MSAGDAAVQQSAPRTGGGVLIGDMRGPVTPVSVEYVRLALAESSGKRCELVVFEMDTPGGLLASTEQIIQEVLAARTPVAVFVSPAGAQAASAGLYIANASDIIAMAPGTRIGAGHPVSIFGSGGSQGKDKEKGGRDYMGEKVEHDVAAGVRSIATNRGRNAEVYEKMVRESISLTEREAVDQKVIDLIAKDLEHLLAQLDGREVTRLDGAKVTLSLARARLTRFEMTARQRALRWIADPNISFILFGIAVLGLYVEFNNPGLIAPGVIGGIALVLFAVSVQILPINLVGLLLIALAVSLFVLEIKFASYGLLTLGGIASLTLGFLALFDTEQMPSAQVSLAFILPTSLTVGGVMLAVTWLAVRAQRERVVTGSGGLIGEIGQAMTDVGAEGKVFVHGEVWNATAGEPIGQGQRIRVKGVRSMRLEVEPAER